MIHTITDLLTEIQVQGIALIHKYENIKHPVLIGDMYEGLTHEMLNSAIFKNLDLKVVSGKIKNSFGGLSGEIDCMLVEGIGEQLPFTEKFIYHFNQVIAVIQVKKTLFTNSLDDSYSNLRSVIDVSREPEKDSDAYVIRAMRDAYRGLLKIDLPKREELSLYTKIQQHVYHALMMEAYFPVRIVLGYYGFKSEHGLREGFVKMLDQKVKDGPTRGYGGVSMPNLIICGNQCLLKNNGMPFGMPFLDQEFYWPLYVSSPNNSTYILLELIWTRLSYKYNISSGIFGDDFDTEPMHEFINCKFGEYEDGKEGWMYSYYPYTAKQLLEASGKRTKWQPQFLSQKQFATISRINESGFIFTDSLINEKASHNDKNSFATFIDELKATGLIYERDGKLYMLTDSCIAVILPDGRYCIGENRSGEFEAWLKEYEKSRIK